MHVGAKLQTNSKLLQRDDSLCAIDEIRALLGSGSHRTRPIAVRHHAADSFRVGGGLPTGKL